MDMRAAVKEALETLTPREAKVLRMRFGIDTPTDFTLEELGKQFDVTRERIRQIESKALKKVDASQPFGQAARVFRGEVRQFGTGRTGSHGASLGDCTSRCNRPGRHGLGTYSFDTPSPVAGHPSRRWPAYGNNYRRCHFGIK
jgi:hypothetical protein